MWDATTSFGQRVERRLNEEAIIWLVTTDANGVSQPSPVWFLREGDTLLIYSQPNTPKMRNIERNSQVALHFDGDGRGGDIVVFHGAAAADPAAPSPDQHQAYLAKYGDGIAGIGMTPESFAAAYSAALRVTLTRVRGH
ncbi:MAG: TIGR03667 family PPOX class F420-dependent oxidoreductase [Oscillochloris sp.]|nr:TIGR03667 family PPOX class F420-dependent oxidoreductase [Oscillochloris sp.]